MTNVEELEARLGKVEDELTIRRLILGYGPSADAGLSKVASARWLEDGLYDWDADGIPHQGRAAVNAMLQTKEHIGLIGSGVAHFAGPPLIDLTGDTATALTYSLIMRRDAETGTFYLWRLSAVRWDLERSGTSWLIRRRTNRLLDETGGGRDMFIKAFAEAFEGQAL